MSNPLFDDVKELLDKEKGDERILKQILRACENNEVISNYERNYVRKLAEKHLGRKPLFEEKTQVKESRMPDVVLAESAPISKPPIFQKEPQPSIPKSGSKNTKVILGIGGVLAVIVVMAIAFTGMTDISQNTDVTKPPMTTSFLVETDSTSYQKKDIISISGKSITTGTVNLSIENQDGVIIWSEQVKTKSDGRFSTLVIAAGSGWEKSGTYALKAQSQSETQSKTFSFNA
jgi:hypothetical protein